jgi:hypothetical protein
MATKTKEEFFVSIDGERIELTGADKDAFIAQREADKIEQTRIETEQSVKQKARQEAIKKLADIAGLTEAEINAIL